MDERRGRFGLQTVLIHPGVPEGEELSAAPARKGLAPILERSSTFRLDAAAEHGLATGEDAEHLDIYGRYGTSTTREVARLVARLEGSEAALLFSSGTAAVATVFASMVPAGASVMAASDLYGGTEMYLREEMPARGIDCIRFNVADPAALDRQLQGMHAKPAVVWCESIANPLLHVAPLEAIASVCGRHGVPLAVDNTFAAGMAIRPLEVGANVVVHSATKYLNGHSDVVAGVACASQSLVRKLWLKMNTLGGCIDPAGAWLLSRGMRTLPLRWARQCQTARALADALAQHRAVRRVYYPGRADHPSYDVACRTLKDFGAMVSLDLQGEGAAARRFVEHLRLCSHATSLGGIETLVCVPARSSHARLSHDERTALGIGDGLVRLSIGLEDFADLWSDLAQALDAA